jgi:hypothetical protein
MLVPSKLDIYIGRLSDVDLLIFHANYYKSTIVTKMYNLFTMVVIHNLDE